MGVSGSRLIVGTSKRQVLIYDVRSLGQAEQRRESSLMNQTRCIRGFPDATGYALSSIEGRVAIEYFNPATELQSLKYAFKCRERERVEASCEQGSVLSKFSYSPPTAASRHEQPRQYGSSSSARGTLYRWLATHWADGSAADEKQQSSQVFCESPLGIRGWRTCTDGNGSSSSSSTLSLMHRATGGLHRRTRIQQQRVRTCAAHACATDSQTRASQCQFPPDGCSPDAGHDTQ